MAILCSLFENNISMATTLFSHGERKIDSEHPGPETMRAEGATLFAADQG